MNKRLTEEERSWLKSSIEKDLWVYGDGYIDESYRLAGLLESEQAAWEEVERLKWDIRGLKYRQEVHKDLANQIHKQLQDALNTLEAIANHPDGDPTDEMLQVKWDAQQAVQRIQEGKQS